MFIHFSIYPSHHPVDVSNEEQTHTNLLKTRVDRYICGLRVEDTHIQEIYIIITSPPTENLDIAAKCIHTAGISIFFFKCIAINEPAEQHRRSIHRNMYRCSSLHQEFVLCLVDVGDHSSYCCYFMGLQFQQ